MLCEKYSKFKQIIFKYTLNCIQKDSFNRLNSEIIDIGILLLGIIKDLKETVLTEVSIDQLKDDELKQKFEILYLYK